MHEQVQEYYGKVLEGSDDLQTNACCTDADMPGYLKKALANIHDEVLMRYYGCGLVSPQQLQGCRILDLGSGSGRDCYVLSQFVGEEGSVVGVDMTDEQLEVANRHLGFHAEKFGYGNVEFRKGYIEKLDELELEENSFDIIISNCVINLSPDKEAVLREAYSLLKPGGEMYFSDVYSDRRIPQTLVDDPVLYGECLSGALYWNDFHNLARKVGFSDPRLVEDRPITIDNPCIETKVGHIGFYSATYRLFKIEGLELFCEDYGQAVIYKGSVEHNPQDFLLDKHHLIPTGKVFPVCGNTYRMLNESRFSEHFEFIGNWDKHFGIFDGCGTSLPFDKDPAKKSDSSGGCC
ncbi:methyltransferase domain-containing protein [Neptuniibacter sp.]|uniref:methyltransferase domain-containing protein n=1 Tax=Neptuniibacter sp. TaxID=1962643 RepID=UPI002606177E|nr:methyltransferase domain-containing protein [Neptuniibacter sp.]MCP4595140.1 methyltransferase domain-containing protein [Neptuniibacter sp.]